MPEQDYSILDQPLVLSFVFYPRKDVTPPPPNATDHLIPVDRGVAVACRFYSHSPNAPSVIYFHGNGEVTSDYDYIAPLYNQMGINLFVADYRGYGASGGSPTFSKMVSDAPVVFKAFADILKEKGYREDVFAMGRSLGSVSALEIAHHHQKQLKGLIIESGFASVSNLLEHLGIPAESLGIEDPDFPNLARIRTVTIPTLIIHGEYDSLIPLTEGEALFQNAAASKKELVIIPGAEHNDIMLVGTERYFEAVGKFVLG